MMSDAHLQKLKTELIQLGFPANTASNLDIYRNSDSPTLMISSADVKGEDHLYYAIHYEKNENLQYQLKDYILTVGNIPAPEQYAELNARLIIADGKVNKYYADEEEPGDREFFESVYDELTKLHQLDPAGAELLMFKFWPEQEYKKIIADDSSLRQQYLCEVKVDISAGQIWTADDAYQYLKTSMKEHVLSDKLLAAARIAIAHGNVHVAYNDIPYFLDTRDVSFFKTPDEAHEFSMNNISEYDNYNVIVAHSIDELLRLIPYGEAARIKLIINQKNLPMNQENYDSLAKKLKYTDFGEDLLPLLKKKMESGEKEFTLAHQRNYEKDETVATLQFRRSENDQVYFNRYTLVLKNEQYPDAIKQTFFIANNPSDFSLKQAYNLLQGRAVYKEGLVNREQQAYNAWQQLDFKISDAHGNYKLHPYSDKYGFNLEKALNVHTIKEMNETVSRERLMESLQRGNRQTVTMTVQGSEQKLWIEAAPKFKSINIYNEAGVRLKPEDLYLKQGVSPSQKEDVKQSVKQDEIKQDISQQSGRRLKEKLDRTGGDDLDRRPKKQQRQKIR